MFNDFCWGIGESPVNVSELIARLQKLPSDAMVRVADWNEAYASPTELDRMTWHPETNEVVLEE